MKVLLLNGSRRESGCTYTALSIAAQELNTAGIETEILHIGKRAVNGEIDTLVKEIIAKMKESDGLIAGTPVYFAGPSGEIKAVLDRLFMTAEKDLRLKPAAAIASARRGGTTAALDVLNKYFTYCEMPVVSSRYWNIVHGFKPEDVMNDKEGVQIVEVLGRNMAWLLKSIEAGKQAGIKQPEEVHKVFTHFINNDR